MNPSYQSWYGLLAGAAMAIAVIAYPTGVGAQDLLGQRIIMSGHSLTDPIPMPLRAMALAAGAMQDVVVDGSTIPGSPMDWRWAHPATPDAKTDIGRYDVLVLTERVPLSNTLPYHNSPAVALTWLENSWRHGADGRGAQTILYSSWVEIDSGPDAENPHGDDERHIPWRERLPLEFARWMEIADYVNANLPEGAAPMRIIPATLVFAAAYDEIIAGKAPGFSEIADLFLDNIHVNWKGAYLAALPHYAVIYDRDPRGLPTTIGLPVSVTPEQGLWMQELVRDVVTTFQSLETRHLNGDLDSEALQLCLWQNLRQLSPTCVLD